MMKLFGGKQLTTENKKSYGANGKTVQKSYLETTEEGKNIVEVSSVNSNNRNAKSSVLSGVANIGMNILGINPVAAANAGTTKTTNKPTITSSLMNNKKSNK